MRGVSLMAWNAEQESIFQIWAGRVPLVLLASFCDKSTSAVAQKASRSGISISFFGGGIKKLSDRQLVEQMVLSGELTNSQITKKLGLKKHYVANVRRRMNAKKSMCKNSSGRIDHGILNAVFK